MTDQRKADLIKGWDSLTSTEQEALFSYFKFMVEKGKPGYQAKVDAEIETYRVQLAKVSDLKSRIDEASSAARLALLTFLPDKARNVLIQYDLLRFLTFAAEYKPNYLYEQGGLAYSLAERTIQQVLRRLPKLEKGQG